MRSSLYIKRGDTFRLFELNLIKATNNELLEVSKNTGIGLNLREMKKVQKYFRDKKRNPTDIELEIFGQTWSEHCCHKTFNGKIRINKKEIDSLFKTYIKKATKEINAKWCISVFEDNAGIINFNEQYGIAAKVETHNHPSAVEPFGGAATGVGGAIRDILGVWAEPIACTDVLGFGPLNYKYEKLPLGVKHPKYVFRGVVAGIGSYGNNMGIPTINGAIYFDESYVGNVVVYCGCLGILPINKFRRKAKPGDVIVLAGGKTGRDGIHGVTFASAELTEKSETISRPAVQIANPIEEEKLKRAIIKIRNLELGSAITDLGGGGLSSAVGETANKFNCGAIIDLDKVPLKYSNIAPWEIYISESQERMLIAVSYDKIEEVIDVFQSEEVEATVIGKYTPNKKLIINYNGSKIVDLDLSFLFEIDNPTSNAEYKPFVYKEPRILEPKKLTNTLHKLLSSPNIASKEEIIRTYDHEVKGNTILKPLQGIFGGPNNGSIIKPLNNSNRGITISCGMNPNYGKIDTYWMAASAIDEAIRNNIAIGGRRIALLDNFTWGNPEKPDRLGSLVRACEACYDFAKAFKTPFISGKDSLYNESPLGPITPTLLITAVGIIPNIKSAVSMEIKDFGDPIYMLGTTRKELGGSEYYKLKGYIGKTIPKVNKNQAKTIFECITKAIDSNLVKACHDLSEGGLGTGISEMAFSGGKGIEISLSKIPRFKLKRNDFTLFSESNSRFLVEVKKDKKDVFEKLIGDKINYAEIGQVTKNQKVVIQGLKDEIIIEEPIWNLLSSWKKPFSKEE